MGDAGIWKGLFEWSMKYQDGSQPTQARPMSNENRKWLEDALREQVVDLNERMKEIKGNLDQSPESGLTLEDKEFLLDELMEIVESIDQARDLGKVGGVGTLLQLLKDPEASLRWRAAEVIATCVQNNPPVQRMFMEEGVFPRLLDLLADPDPRVSTKALLAISCMVRGNAAALDRLRLLGGVGRIAGLLGAEEPRLQRKALQLLAYVLREQPGEALALCAQGLPDRLAALLDERQQDDDVRQAALAVVVQVAHIREARPLMMQARSLQEALAHVRQRLEALSEQEAEALQDQQHLLDALQQTLAAPPTLSAASSASAGLAMVPLQKKP